MNTEEKQHAATLSRILSHDPRVQSAAGNGTLRTIIECAVLDDPGTTPGDIVQIVLDAESDASTD